MSAPRPISTVTDRSSSASARSTRRRHRGRRVASLVAVVLAVAGCTTGTDDDAGPAPSEEATGAACGEATSDVAFDRDSGLGALPTAALGDLADPDSLVCTTAWEGTPTVVNFWASWCGPCRAEMPDLQAADQELGEQVRFVGIDVQDNVEDARAFLDETGVTYDNVVDGDRSYFEEVGNRGMPTTLFVAADGEVLHRFGGPITDDLLRELIEEHLGVTA